MAPSDFAVGQRVFARIHSYPPWPGWIKNEHSSPTRVLYAVYLYKIGVYVKLPASKLIDYREYMNQNENDLTALMILLEAIEGSKMRDSLDNEDQEPLMTARSNDMPLSRNSVYHRLHSLRLEVKLLKYDFRIKRNLPMERIQGPYSCIKAIQALDKILKLPVLNEYVLKKYPSVVNTVLRLRTYRGNPSQWHMTRVEKRLFEILARRIRRKAFAVYRLFRETFKVPKEVSFTKMYYSELKRF